jgi:hypothetical protein
MQQVAFHRRSASQRGYAANVFAVSGTKRQKEHRMLDVILIALGLGFFFASIAYTYACDRL